MAVYTSLSRVEVDDFTRLYDLDPVTEFTGIEAGVENTNYRINCGNTPLVLTLFEILSSSQLPYFHDLLSVYYAAHVPAAPPLLTNKGKATISLAGKPAALFPLLPGEHVLMPENHHCYAVGETLGKMHLAADGYARRSAWDLNHEALKKLAARVLPRMHNGAQKQLKSALKQLPTLAYGDLPNGTIHGDLFRDNVLFNGDAVSGVLDPYTAHHSVLLYDLAITATDWCTDSQARFMPDRVSALLEGYNGIRRLTVSERKCWQDMLTSAALRFWLSRLRDWYFPRSGELVKPRDPDFFASLHFNISRP